MNRRYPSRLTGMPPADRSPSPRRRTYGSGSIRKKGPNRWELRVRIRDPLTGVSRQVSHTVRGTRAEATRDLRALAATGEGALRRQPRITVLEMVKRYLKSGAQRGLKKKTLYEYAHLWSYVEDDLGPLDPEALQPTWVDDYFQQLVDDGIGAPTVIAIRRL
jgi:hypothetical protein